MARERRHVSPGAIRGHASGVLLVACFGNLWASSGADGRLGWGGPLPTIATILLGVVLVGGAIVLWRGVSGCRPITPWARSPASSG